MPKIDLKSHSPEFSDDKSGLIIHECNMPGCREKALHKAPKDRSLSEYYYFCLEHVQEYNQAWNFFSGMSQADLEKEVERSSLWDRPTWSYKAGAEDELRTKAWQTYESTEEPYRKQKNKKTIQTRRVVHLNLTPCL